MKKVIRLSDHDLKRKEHIYELERCAGCNRVITEGENCYELELDEGRVIRYILLCEACEDESHEHIDY